MTGTAKKITLDFGRIKDAAAMSAATVGVVAVTPLNPDAPWQMPDTPEALKAEINRAQAFLNDREYKMRMAEVSEATEKMGNDVEAMDQEVEKMKKTFAFGILTGRGRAVAKREEELKELEAELKELQAKEQKMRAGYDEAKRRLEKMNDRLDVLEGRPSRPKPKKPGFTL